DSFLHPDGWMDEGMDAGSGGVGWKGDGWMDGRIGWSVNSVWWLVAGTRKVWGFGVASISHIISISISRAFYLLLFLLRWLCCWFLEIFWALDCSPRLCRFYRAA